LEVPDERKWFKHRDLDTIVSYAVVSVRQQKQSGDLAGALRTARFSAAMHPLDPLYYKPLLLLLTPAWLSEGYAAIKRQRLECKSR
jgi:hypothetical protein